MGEVEWLALALLLLPVFGALANTYEPAIRARYPRLAAVLVFVFPALEQALRAWKSGGRDGRLPPSSPPPRPGNGSGDPPGVAMRLAVGFLGGVVIGLAAFISPGCASSPEKLTTAVTAGARLLVIAEPMLVKAYELQQLDCLERPEPEQRPCVERVRRDWQALEDAWAATRTALCDLESTACEARQ